MELSSLLLVTDVSAVAVLLFAVELLFGSVDCNSLVADDAFDVLTSDIEPVEFLA